MNTEIISKNIDRCIYCFDKKENLTDEHVIPFALGGNLILRNACCEKCRDLTSRCERHPLKINWAEARACLDYPSRKRKFENEIFSLKVVLKNGKKSILNLKKDEVLGIAQFLELDIPAIFKSKEKYTGGSVVIACSTFSFGKVNIEKFCKKHDIKSFSFSIEHKGNDFEIMLAKIAYCYVVSNWGVDCFKDIFVLPAILRQKDDIGYWVGGNTKNIIPAIGKQSGKNVLKFGIFTPPNSSIKYIVVRLKFFANANTPEYIVIVGSLSNSFQPVKTTL